MTQSPYIQPEALPYIETIRNGVLSLSNMLDELEERFNGIEPYVKAYIPEDGRFERLRKEAIALEKHYPEPSSRPPLYGVLVGIKDIFHVNGFETLAGTHVPSHLFAGKEAAIVTKFKQLGALIVGKTVTTEFAYFEPGPTRNPYNLEHTPGGSSSGSAAAIASGLAHVTTGTQTVGSVIRPAAFCGVVGYKPSYDRIDTAGLVYFSRSVDHVGLFTQNIEDMQKVAEFVLNDWQSNKPFHEKPVLGVPEGAYLQQCTALDAFENDVKLLDLVQYRIKHVPMFDDIQTISELHSDMIAAELAHEHADWFAPHQDLYRERTANLIRYGKTISPERLQEGRDSRLKVRERIQKTMDEHQIDLWICPPAPDVAPEGIHSTGNAAMNLPWTHAGIPCVTVPSGVGNKGLPLGLQVCARFGADEQLLSWAQRIESVWA